MSTIPKEYLTSEWDFGFTAVDEETVSSPIVTNVTTTAEEQLRAKLLEVEKLIIPLMVNLMKDPDKEYIHWPNRTPLIQKQVDKILSITRG
jgi:hypothetical protein